MAGIGARVALAPLAELADAAAAVGDDWLLDDERARLAAMTSPLRRRQFLAGHWFARELAGRVLDLAPARLALATDAAGRPRLHVDASVDAGFVSLSHSGDWIAAAIASAPVGIDVEFPTRPRDLSALARFTFSDDECARLEALAGHERDAGFYELWTLKEARGKRSGEGLLPGRARAFSAEACAAGQAEAATWRLGAGTLAVAAADVARLDPVGLPDAVAASYWRYVQPSPVRGGRA
jgi:4'-phosphopantetheinyl transferase